VDEAKPFDIPKREVWEAFKKVKANQGAAGVDGQSITDFEVDLSNNLYKCWPIPPRRRSNTVCRQNISDDWLGNLRECLAHLV
jgi:hypothetical protein